MKKIFLILNFVLALNIYCAEIIGEAVKIIDGDTFILKEETVTIIPTGNENVKFVQQGKFKIRLADIDAPELKQQFGEQAKTHLQMLISSARIKVIFHQIDMYGRIVGTIYLTDKIIGIDVSDNESINERMVRDGYAWWFSDYSKKYWFSKLETEAKISKRGIWSEENNIPPWIFRKQNKK